MLLISILYSINYFVAQYDKDYKNKCFSKFSESSLSIGTAIGNNISNGDNSFEKQKEINLKDKAQKNIELLELSTDTMILSIVMNSCILFYMIIHSQYPMIAYCSIMILLELLLIYMKNTHGKMKKSSSQTNLLEMENV